MAEQFDPERFSLWLEVMLEAGAERVAQRLTELPEELVTFAFHQLALVINIDQLALEMSGGDGADLLEKALGDVPHLELGEYRLMARRHDGWDALSLVVAALDQDHHEFLERLLERCGHATAEHLEENGGLYRVLTIGEMFESDAAGEREDRRSAEGFVAPTDAAAFLKRAALTPLDELTRAAERDPITRAYFRRWAGPRKADSAARPPETSWAVLLEESDHRPAERPRRLTGVASTDGLFVAALTALAERDPEAHARRIDELGYLANVLLAGSSIEGRRYRPVEAAEAAVALCNRGLVHLCDGDAARAAERLATDGADKLFSIGWRLRHLPK